MKNQIIFRPIIKKDYLAIEKIIREAWHYDEFCTSKIAKLLSKIFLSSCLSNQTFTLVALLKEQPIGIIMGKNIKKHKCPFKYRVKQGFNIFNLLIRKEGRKTAKIFKAVNNIDKVLLQQTNQDYQGELSFFAIDAQYRGLGLGKELFNLLISYMQEQQINRFYLYTDTSCNYHFYEHLGMMRRVEQTHCFKINNEKNVMHFFIYDYLCKKTVSTETV